MSSSSNIELEKLLFNILKNNKITLTESFSNQIYEKYLYPYRKNIDTYQEIPIQDLLNLNQIPWNKISAHSQLSFEIMRKNFSNLNFELLVQNQNLPLEEIVDQLNQENTFNPENWNLIGESDRLTFEIIDKYHYHFNLLKILKSQRVKLSSDQKYQLLKHYHGDSFDYIITLLQFQLPFGKFLPVFSNWIKRTTLKKLKIKEIESFVEYYSKAYIPSITLVHDLKKVFELIITLIEPDSNIYYFRLLLINTLIQLPNFSLSEAKQLVDLKITLIFPSKPILSRKIAKFYYQQATTRSGSSHSVNIFGHGDNKIKKGALTLDEYNDLIINYNYSPTDSISYSLLNQYIKNKVDIPVSILETFMEENADSLPIIHNFYHLSKKYKEFTKLWEYFLTSHYPNYYYSYYYSKITSPNSLNMIRIPEYFVLCFYLDNYQIPHYLPINSWKLITDHQQLVEKFKTLFNTRFFSCDFLKVILGSDQITTDLVDYIVAYQNLTPEIINQYQGLMKWDLVSCNVIWKNYSVDQFTKAPIQMDCNWWLFASKKEKIKVLTNWKGSYKITLYSKDPNWIVFPNTISNIIDNSTIGFQFQSLARNCYHLRKSRSNYYGSCSCQLCSKYSSVNSNTYSRNNFSNLQQCLFNIKDCWDYFYRPNRSHKKTDLTAVKTYRFLIDELNIYEINHELYIKTRIPGIVINDS